MGGWFRTAAVAAFMLAAAAAASAQSFPSKPVHIFVPYPAGGGVDVLTRTLGDVVSKQWGQSVVVENRPGAGGVIASQAVVDLAAGWLHPDHGGERPCHQSVPVSENSLRHVQGFHPDFAAGVVAQYPAGARGFAVQDGGRCDRGGEGQAGQPVICPCRHRHVDASGRRTPEEPRQDRSQRHSLQGRRARDQRSARRANSDVVQQRPGIGRPACRPARCARSRSPPPSARRSCPMCPACRRPCRATTPSVWWGLLGPAGMPPDVAGKALA